MSEFVKELNYARPKATAVASRPVINRYRANNHSHTANQWIEIEIQTGTPGLHLFPHDSYLEGIVDVVNGLIQTGNVDGNLYGLFRTLEVVVGGQVMERIPFCGKLFHVLNDIQVNDIDRYHQSVSLGGSTTARGAAIAAATTGPVPVITTLAFSFVLPSAILGSLATKALPLSQLNNSSVLLRLEVDNVNNWVINNSGTIDPNATLNGTASSVRDVYFNAKCSMLPSDVERDLIASTGGQILLPAVSYNGELKQISSSTDSFNDKFSFQYDSLNAILFWFMPTGGQNVTTHRSQTGRSNRNMNEYYLDINGERYPSSGPVGHPTSATLAQSRFITELRRSFDMLGTNESCGILSSINYKTDNGNVANVAANTELRSVYGLDLNRFNASQEQMFSGINTRGQQISLNCKFSAVAANTTDHYLYAVAMYDIIYSISQGLMTARY